MGDFKERLYLEIEELDKKIDGLSKFTATADFMNLSQANQSLLQMQSAAMFEYFNILQIRIELLAG